jgi:hypothetical protein
MSRANLKSLAATSAIAGGLALAAIGLGAGVASAAPVSPITGPVTWSQDKHGHGHDWGDGDDWNRGDWGNWGGPAWNGPIGCISGPVGWGSGFICI